MRSLLTKTLYDKRWFILGWSLGMAFMSALVLAFFPALSEGQVFDNLSESMPEQLQSLIGDVATFSQLPGYLATQLYGIRVPLFIMIMALILAISLTVTEENKGQFRTLLSTPLSRIRVALEKWLAGVLIILFITIATTIGVYIGLLGIGETFDHGLITELSTLTFVFGLTAFTIPFGIGLATGNRAATMTVGILVTAGSYILSSFAKSVDWLESWDVLSLIHYYDSGSLVADNLNNFHLSVLIVLIVTGLVIGTMLFRTRDINDN